jgi:sugar phosphate isomerase/epimerase
MKFPIALQLYSVRGDLSADFEGTLKRVKDMGYDGIEFAGLFGKTAAQVKEMCKTIGLIPVSAHVPFVDMINDPSILKTYAEIGCEYVVIPYLTDEYRPGQKKFQEVIEGAKILGEQANALGLKLAYHNHDFDLKLFGDKSILDRMLELDSDLLWFIPDVAWLHIAGEKPEDYLKKMQGRVKVLHFKDYNPDPEGEHPWAFTELGKGVVDLNACYETAKEMGIPYIMFEQDNNWTVDAMQSSKEAFEFMKKLG